MLFILFVVYNHRYMIATLSYFVASSLWCRTHTAAMFVRAHVDKAGLDPQIVGVDSDILLLGLIGRVRDRRIQTFLDRVGGTLVRELQDRECTRDIYAADQVDHEPRLTR